LMDYKDLNLFRNSNLIFWFFWWMLPKMSGLICVKLFWKKDTTHRYCFLTARTVQETIEGIKVGANDYIETI
jgi:DNA-binding response OmpR family regulator